MQTTSQSARGWIFKCANTTPFNLSAVIRASSRMDNYIQWCENKTKLRAMYRAAGFPFGRNDGAFKRWVLTRPQNFWKTEAKNASDNYANDFTKGK